MDQKHITQIIINACGMNLKQVRVLIKRRVRGHPALTLGAVLVMSMP